MSSSIRVSDLVCCIWYRRSPQQKCVYVSSETKMCISVVGNRKYLIDEYMHRGRTDGFDDNSNRERPQVKKIAATTQKMIDVKSSVRAKSANGPR